VSYDLLVVGASFAGLACARAAALEGLRVLLVDKKPAAGARLHTTGMIVKDAVDTIPWLRDVPRDLVQPIEGVRLYAPNLTFADLRAPGYYFWATDVPRLMEWMVGLVRAAGAELRFGALYTGARRGRDGEPWSVQLGSARRCPAATSSAPTGRIRGWPSRSGCRRTASSCSGWSTNTRAPTWSRTTCTASSTRGWRPATSAGASPASA
jgi:flavin-dependent dehydrogenase